MTKTSFADQLQDMWRTRPVRFPDKGPVAGVAAGIGYRYGVDPVLIRVAFAVSTIFGGAGIVLYLAGWLLMSKSGDQSSAAHSLFGKGHSSESQTKTIVLVVALVIAASTLGPIGVGMGGSGLISMALMLGGLWLLHQRQPVPPPLPAGVYGAAPSVTGYPGTEYTPGPFTTPTAGTTEMYSPYTRLPEQYVPDPPRETAPTEKIAKPESTPSQPDSKSTTQAGHTETRYAGQPPSWDPLGVAPFAWDLPEPATPAEPLVTLPRTRSRLTSVVIGLAILAAAGATAGSFAGADWLTPARIGAIALAVVGVGLVIGAFLRRGYGLMTVTGPLLGFVLLASVVGPVDWDSANMGSKTWTPTAMADLQPEYKSTLGEGVLDLRGLKLTENRTVHVKQELGNFKVLLPDSMNVKNKCSMTLGDAACLPEGVNKGKGVADNAPTLNLNIDGRLGNVEVRRG